MSGPYRAAKPEDITERFDEDSVSDLLQDPIPKPVKRPVGRPRKETTTPPKPSTIKVSLEVQIAALLTSLNFIVLLTPFRDDALDPAEITALAKAVDQQAKASPQFKSYVEFALKAGNSGQIVGVLVMISVRRAARHGYINKEFDGMVGAMFAVENASVPTMSPFRAPDRNDE
jgi:hypothetical protein